VSLPKIIAVDFDGCLVEDRWPAIGDPIQSVIDALKAKQAAGYKIILSTCRRGQQLEEAIIWCAGHGIVFDAINKNLPEVIQHYGGDTRKISADEYWGDDARRMPERVCRYEIMDIPVHGPILRCVACGLTKTADYTASWDYCSSCGGRIIMEARG